MPKSLILKPHLSSEELKLRYRNSSDPVERSHYQIIWLLASGKTVPEVSSITDYSTKWIYQLASRYNQSGERGLGELLAAALALPPTSKSRKKAPVG